MESEDQCTIPLDDTDAIERFEFEPNLEPSDINETEVLDVVPDSCEYATAEIMDDFVKDIVLDSDEEGTEAVGCRPSLKQMEETRCKWKLNTLVYRRRKSKKTGGNSSGAFVSARRTIAEEHIEAEKHGPVSFHDSDIRMPTLEEEILHDPNKIVHNDNQSLGCSEKLIRRNLAVDVTDAERLPSSHCETKHGERDVRICRQSKFETFMNTDSQEAGEPSYVNALDFVDYFLSVNNLNTSEKVDVGKVDVMKSPPIFSAKGAQTLARRANFAAKAREFSIFDWDEIPSSEGHFIKVPDEELDVKSLGQSPENDESGTNVPDTFDVGFDTQMAAKAREFSIFDWDEIPSSEGHFIKVPDEELDVKSLGQSPENDESGTNVPDTFEVGFDTQMAAEAIEALIYAAPPNTQAQHIHQVPKTEISNLSGEAHCSKESKICANLKMCGSVSQNNKKQLDSMKTTSTKLNANISCPLRTHSDSLKEYVSPFPLENDAFCRVPLAAKSLNCREHLIAKKATRGRNSRFISQQKEDENSQIENSKGAGDILSSSKFTTSKQRGEDTIVKESRKSSNATKINKSKSLVRSSWVSDDPVSGSKRRMNNNLEFNVPKKRRTRGCEDVNICKTNKRKLSNSSSDAFLAIMNSKRTQQERRNSVLFGTGIPLKLDPWCYTKQKRTHKGVPRQSRGSGNSSTLLSMADEENKDTYLTRPTISNHGPLLSNQTACHSFPEKRLSGKVSKKRVDGKSMPGPYKYGSAITSEQMLPLDLCRATSSNQSGKSDIMSPAEKIKLDKISADTEASRNSKSNEECWVPNKKLLSNPSLLKELARLGYSKSLPNFIPRELRRRRNQHVSVLFSQHLEPTILNQQKKIITRLGFSVASCCSDATHFVTDRFVRTKNMLEAIALGKPVVTHCWLESCDQANCFIDETCYILRDAKKEKEIGFSMPVSLACASQNPLLMGRSVFVTPNVKPCMGLVVSLVKAVHGKEDYAICMPLLRKGAAIYDPELLLNGIVIQRLEFERHQLFSIESSD